MERLIKTNPELFENPTLGEANPTTFLEEVELQKNEDRSARLEGREQPLIARREIRYPTVMPSGTVPSSIQPVVNMVEPGSFATPNEDVLKSSELSEKLPPAITESTPVVENDSDNTEDEDEFNFDSLNDDNAK
jgi:hypothetical protein